MMSTLVHPRVVQASEVADVECDEGAPGIRRPFQLARIVVTETSGLGSGDGIKASRSNLGRNLPINILVREEADRAQWALDRPAQSLWTVSSSSDARSASISET